MMEQAEYICHVCGKHFLNYQGKKWVYRIKTKEVYSICNDKKYYKYSKHNVCSYGCQRNYENKVVF